MSKHLSSYQAIVAALQTQIQTGRLSPGEKLPSEHELSQTFSVSRQTVRHALELLRRDRLIEKRQGSGSYVPADYSAPTARPEQRGPKVINVITPFMDSYIFPNQISGIEDVLSSQGCAIHLGVTYNKLEHEGRILKSILGARPDGVIAEPTASALPPVNGALYQALCDEGIPVLFINTCIPALPIPCVALDDRKGGCLATRHLIEQGHRRIAYVGKVDTHPGHLRFAGYADALSAAGIPLDEARIVWFPSGDMNDWLSPVLSDYLLRRLQDCTAVFCYNDQIACTLIELLRQRDVRIPDDISIVGFDDSDYSRQSQPPCTTVRHPSYDLGAAAAGAILDMIQTGGVPPIRTFDPVLVKRGSVLRLPGDPPPEAARIG